MIPTRNILGVPVILADSATAIDLIDTRIGSHKPPLVAYLNAHISNLAASNSRLNSILNKATVLNDGIGLDIASTVLHREGFTENLEGTSFTPLYLQRTQHIFRIYIVGAESSVAERAAANFRAAAPQHRFVGVSSGYFDDQESEAIIARIRQSGANLVLVGMGSPRQEIWTQEHIVEKLKLPAICVGGLLDFASGNKPRAPNWVRKARCEWMYRLAIEPKRLWRRYLIGNIVFIGRVMSAALRQKAS